MPSVLNDSFCVLFEDLATAAIKKLRKKHPGALPIKIDWVLKGDSGQAVIWWTKSEVKAAEKDA